MLLLLLFIVLTLDGENLIRKLEKAEIESFEEGIALVQEDFGERKVAGDGVGGVRESSENLILRCLEDIGDGGTMP
jgi:hypothetical protein